MPPSPPRFGAQARVHGIWNAVGRKHDMTAVTLVDEEFDAGECERAMREYCKEVVLLPNPMGARDGLGKRTLQLRSLFSRRSFEHHRYHVPALQGVLDGILRKERFDVVNVEFPYLGDLRLRQAPPGEPAPVVVVDSHEIAYDMVRQFAQRGSSAMRRMYARVDWPKLRREEVAAYQAADGVATCSAADAQRVLAHVPGARTAVIPNAADVEFFRPRASDPPPDGRTVLFFGLLSTFPNIDGIRWFAQQIWPRIAAARPDARCRIIGKNPARSVLELARPGVEIVGFVEDLRPHLASAAAVVVPLRIGGGTRLKIVEAMAMSKAIVSTTLGAEGIDLVDGRDILIADDDASFAQSVIRLLESPALGASVGVAARKAAVERYAWSAAGESLERFYLDLLSARSSGDPALRPRGPIDENPAPRPAQSPGEPP